MTTESDLQIMKRREMYVIVGNFGKFIYEWTFKDGFTPTRRPIDYQKPHLEGATIGFSLKILQEKR